MSDWIRLDQNDGAPAPTGHFGFPTSPSLDASISNLLMLLELEAEQGSHSPDFVSVFLVNLVSRLVSCRTSAR